MMKLSEELAWRGFVNQTTLSDLGQLDSQSLTFYHGYDASSDSLTIGNLAALMMDKCFIRHGHKAVLLAGGATSLVGDPGGKDGERPLQAIETINDNVANVTQQIEKLFGGQVQMVNNLDWFKDMSVLDFLRDVGKHFSMTTLVQRDYIARRIGADGAGISYAEFSYTLLQGYDFLRLFEDHGVTLQLAGSDQWGNGLSGVNLIRRVKAAEVHVLSCPLIIDTLTGKKFGKSEDGAIWLDPAKTSVYKFYQYWLNVNDASAEEYLKIFTELDKSHIDDIVQDFQSRPEERRAQKTLAYEVTKLLHGQDQADKVKHVSEVLFGEQSFLELSQAEVQVLREELTVVPMEKDVVRTLVKAGLAASNTEALRFVESGAIYINGQKTTDPAAIPFVQGSNLLKRGKNRFAIVDCD
jgi:tyrosyl-tRNA synthetase